MTSPNRFAQDTDAQAQYVRGLQEDCDNTGAVIRNMQANIDESFKYMQGKYAGAYRESQAKIHVEFNGMLQSLDHITQTMGTGLQQTISQDESGASQFNTQDVGGSFFTGVQ